MLVQLQRLGQQSRGRVIAALSALGHKIKSLGGDRHGNIGIIFAFMILPVTTALGLAVDYGTALKERDLMQGVLDTAALAAGREYQVSGDAARATAYAGRYFSRSIRDGIDAQLTHIRIDVAKNSVEIGARADVPTAFGRIIRQNEIAISAIAKAELAQGGIDHDLEVSLILDVTGSMSGTKLANLKTAAKDLIEILVRENQRVHTSRIALAPFAHAVNAGPYFELATGGAPAGHFEYPSSCYRQSGALKSSCEGNRRYWVDGEIDSHCVTERTGAEAFTDAAPGAGAYTGIFELTKQTVSQMISEPCRPSAATVVPLTSEKAVLKQAVDRFSAGGWTAGHIGTAWGWYLISPEWSDVWPAESQPAAYGDAQVRKVAVLMTDGEFNTTYARAANGTSPVQAQRLCTAMKAKGITVYTVGFDLNEASAINMLRQCASSQENAFVASDGQELLMAFREIGFRLAQLRLSQ